MPELTTPIAIKSMTYIEKRSKSGGMSEKNKIKLSWEIEDKGKKQNSKKI